MKVLFDHQIFSVQKYGGVSRYFIELDRELVRLGVDSKIAPYIYLNKYLKDMKYEHGMHVHNLPNKLRLRLNSYLTRRDIRRFGAPDIMHHTYYTANNYGAKSKTVITVHDMIHEKYWDTFSSAKEYSIKNSDHIICISNNTKKDLLDVFDVDEDKISVIYHGIRQDYQTSSTYGAGFKYILFVGHRDAYKNFSSLLEAYASSSQLKSSVKIIAFGKKFKSHELKYISKLGISGNVLNMTGNDDLLVGLYKGAEMLVYPSKYEGFGLPPLEAMSNGCPVVCSNSSSIPEVVGNAAFLVDPDNTDEIRSAMEQVVESTSVRQDLISAGFERVKLFTWENCAKETLNVYQDLLK